MGKEIWSLQRQRRRLCRDGKGGIQMSDKQFNSIEQAGNFLNNSQKDKTVDAKAQAKEAPISFASPEDRKKYLSYGLSLLEDVTEGAKAEFCRVANKSPVLYTTKEVTKIIKQIMILRIAGYSQRFIARMLSEERTVIAKVEALGLKLVKEVIAHKIKHGIPILN